MLRPPEEGRGTLEDGIDISEIEMRNHHCRSGNVGIRRLFVSTAKRGKCNIPFVGWWESSLKAAQIRGLPRRFTRFGQCVQAVIDAEVRSIELPRSRETHLKSSRRLAWTFADNRPARSMRKVPSPPRSIAKFEARLPELFPAFLEAPRRLDLAHVSLMFQPERRKLS
jgi:hypothetical protein